MLIRSVPSHSNEGSLTGSSGLPPPPPGPETVTPCVPKTSPSVVSNWATTAPSHACIATVTTRSAPTTMSATRRSWPWIRSQGVSPACAIAMPRHRSTTPLRTSTPTRNSLANSRFRKPPISPVATPMMAAASNRIGSAMRSPSSRRPAYACPMPGITKDSTAASQGRWRSSPLWGAAACSVMGPPL